MTRNLWRIAAFLLLSALAMAVLVTALAMQDWDDISGNSPMQLIVDSEIRSIPEIAQGHEAVFRTAPRDGMKPALDSVSFSCPDFAQCEKKIVKHFLHSGYRQLEPEVLERGEMEIRIDRVSDSRLRVSKYRLP